MVTIGYIAEALLGALEIALVIKYRKEIKEVFGFILFGKEF